MKNGAMKISDEKTEMTGTKSKYQVGEVIRGWVVVKVYRYSPHFNWIYDLRYGGNRISCTEDMLDKLFPDHTI